MTLDNKICVQRKIIRETELLFISSDIRRNIRSHDKKINKKKDVTSH